MWLFSSKYKICLNDGRNVKMTAKEILKNVSEDSKNGSEWFTSVQELVRICRFSKFPSDIGILIEAAILNRFSNIDNSILKYPNSILDVTFCYNSLINIKEYEDLRKKYIGSILLSIINYELDGKPRVLSCDNKNKCLDWYNLKLNDFVSNAKKINDLNEFYKIFNDEFESNFIDNGLYDKNERKSCDSSTNNASSWEKVLRNFDYYPDPDQIR